MNPVYRGFDHVEIVVSDLLARGAHLEALGFERVGTRERRGSGTRSAVYAQGRARIVLTAPGRAGLDADLATRHLREHGEGVCAVAFEVDDAARLFDRAVARGARPAGDLVVARRAEGEVTRGELFYPSGDVRCVLVSRRPANASRAHPALFDDELVVARLESPSPRGVLAIDHLTNCVPVGDRDTWVDWYGAALGFEPGRTFDVRLGGTVETGLSSRVVTSPGGAIHIPILVGTEPESHIQEYVAHARGACVQHVALLTSGVVEAVSRMRADGHGFLPAPASYFESVAQRVPNLRETPARLAETGVLADGDASGYLLQIFAAPWFGIFGFEYIERTAGYHGYGDGNFRALTEAAEEDRQRKLRTEASA